MTELKSLQKNLKSVEIFYTSNYEDLSDADIFIVTVPTPIDSFKMPDFSFLKSASKIIGLALKNKSAVIQKNDTTPIVIYEVQYILKLQKKYVFQLLRNIQV